MTLTSVPVGVVDHTDGFDRVLVHIVLQLTPDDLRRVEPVPGEDLGGDDRVFAGRLLNFPFPGTIGAPFALPSGALRDRDLQDDIVRQGIVRSERPCCRVVVSQIQRN
jgi:hypothetical protein